MSTFFGTRKVQDLGSFTISGANTAEFVAGQPAKIKRLILVYSTANSGAGNVLTIKKRVVPGSDSGATTLGTATTTTVIAAGQAEFVEFGEPSDTDGTAVSGAPGIGGQITFAATPDLPELKPGESIAFTSGGQGTSGVCRAFVEYFEGPNLSVVGAGDMANVTKLTFTAS